MSRVRSVPHRILFVLLNVGVACLLSTCSHGQAIDSPLSRRIKPTEITYREIDGHKLQMDLFIPAGSKTAETRPVVLAFHGGAWLHGSRSAFHPHCRYLAERGYIAASVEYRTKFGHGGNIGQSISDGRAAVRFMREHAAKYGIDPNRIIVMGGSAGAHVALSTALIATFDDPASETNAEPNALVLFSPPSDTTRAGWPRAKDTWLNNARFKLVFGEEDKRIAPLYCLPRQTGPTLIVHSRDDTVVPIEQSIKFAEQMQACGNECYIVELHGAAHPFFESRRSPHLHEAMRNAIDFLEQYGMSPQGYSNLLDHEPSATR